MSFFRDLRVGTRSLTQTPALATVCVIALTLGIGLTTMMFSIVYGAMLRGLPYADGDKIDVVYRTNPGQGVRRQSISLQDYRDVERQQQSYSQLAAFTGGTMNVSGKERAERYSGSWVTSNLFGMTGVQPLLGRAFQSAEDVPGGPKVALLSYKLYRDKFGSEPGTIGSNIRINGTPFEIIGVMPEGFRFPSDDDLWVPLQNDPMATPRGEGLYPTVVGKRKPGVSLAQASADLNTIGKRLAADYPKLSEGFTITATGFVDWAMGPEPRQVLGTMLGAVLFVLLIACTNVANLLLDRAANRSKEVGVRSALGAPRHTIIRLFLAEAMVLAGVGAALGLALAYFGIGAFNRAIVDTQPPFFISIGLYPPVIAFAVGVALVATLFSGVIPAYQASRLDIAETLKDESRGSSGLRVGKISKALVVFELALSCGLLVAAGLMIKSVVNAGSSDLGFEAKSVFTGRIGFPAEYTDTTAQRQFFSALDERVSAIAGVQSSAISSGLPGARQGLDQTKFAVDGVVYKSENDYPTTRALSASTGFLETLSIPLRTGRWFESRDRLDALPVAVVNERFATQFFDSKNVIGARVRLGTADSKEEWMTIVGVVADIYGGGQDDPRPPIIFRPFEQHHANFAYVSARASVPPLSLTEPIHDAVESLEADIPLYWPKTLDVAVAEPLWFIRVFGTMFMIFGFVALFLASIGLYAVMSFSVTRRTREMGVRMALGATSGRIVRLILSFGAKQLALGLGIGLVFAAGLSRVMSVLLFDVQPLDITVFGSVTLILALTGIVACYLPALRATRIDAAEAMRTD